MKMDKIAGTLLLVGTIISSVSASIIYEQGITDVVDGHNPFKSSLSYDDFTITSSAIVDKISLNAHAYFGVSDNIGNIDWEIRSVSGSIPGSIIYSGNVASVVKTDTGVNYNSWDLVDYTIDVADFSLAAGSYFLGFKANDAENVHLTLINDPVNISQALVSTGGGTYSDYWNGKDVAFRIEAIPEPASLGLLGLVTGGIYFTRRFFIV